MFGIFGTNYHNFPVTLDYSAFVAHRLNRWSYFHFILLVCGLYPARLIDKLLLNALGSPHDPALGKIVRAHFQLYCVAGEYPYGMDTQFARHVSGYLMVICKSNAKLSVP